MKKPIAAAVFMLLLSGCTNRELPAIYDEPVVAPTQIQVIESTPTPIPEETPALIPEPTPTPIPIIENPDIRGVKWGMSIEEVQIYEQSKFLFGGHEAQGLAYADTLHIYNVNVYYYFTNDKLNKIICITQDRHSQYNTYLTRFMLIKDLFVSKYGTPKEEKEKWFNDLYKGDPNDYGKAVARGDLIYSAEWDTDTTNIIMFLDGDNYEIIGATIIYTPLDYVETIDDSNY